MGGHIPVFSLSPYLMSKWGGGGGGGEKKKKKKKGDKVEIEFDPKSTTSSKSGKTIILASSGGFQWEGDVGISYNIVKRK